MKQQILGFMAILYFLFSNFNGLILMEQQNYSALFIKRKFRFLVDVILIECIRKGWRRKGREETICVNFKILFSIRICWNTNWCRISRTIIVKWYLWQIFILCAFVLLVAYIFGIKLNFRAEGVEEMLGFFTINIRIPIKYLRMYYGKNRKINIENYVPSPNFLPPITLPSPILSI